jgi:hypothetical protein
MTGVDWPDALCLSPLLIASAAVWASMHWQWVRSVPASLALWWRNQEPWTERGARRMKNRARAEAPDWGEMDDGEWTRWRLLVADYFDEDDDALTGPMGESW